MSDEPRSNGVVINRRIVGLGDYHYPEGIDLSPVIKFIRDVKPTHLLLVGDMLDLLYLSHFEKGKQRKLEGKRLKSDYDGFSKVLDTLQGAAGKDCEIYFFPGNHEDRIDACLDAEPGLAEGFVEIENGLEFKRRGIKKIAKNGYLRIGRLTFMHAPPSHTDFYTKAAVEKYVANLVVWHMHSRQEYTKITPIERHDMMGVGVGCLCNKNPEYMANKPNRWVHGFAYVEMDTEGYFQLYNLVIERGKLIWKGKIYY